MIVLWFDVETTGLDPVKNEITQFAGVVSRDGKEVMKINENIRPSRWENISDEALKVQNKTLDDLKGYQDVSAFIAKFGRLFNMLATGEKFLVAGQNVKFDIEFLKSFFKKNLNSSYDDYFHPYEAKLDLLDQARRYHISDVEGLRNNKLETLCKFFDIEIVAHDELSDIEATRKCLFKLHEWQKWQVAFEGVTPNCVCNFKKYKGMKWGEIASIDKRYVRFAIENPSDFECFRHFKASDQLKRLVY